MTTHRSCEPRNSTTTGARAESPFGPMRKRRRPGKPGIPPQRRESDPLPPAKPKTITPLLLAGRTRPTATVTDLLRAHLNRIDLEWGLHLAHTAISDDQQAQAATRLHQLATQAHTAPDLADYRSAA